MYLVKLITNADYKINPLLIFPPIYEIPRKGILLSKLYSLWS